MKMWARLRLSVFLLLMAAVAWFFSSQVRDHWSQLTSSRLTIQWPWIVGGLVLVVAHYLMATDAWRRSLHGASTTPLPYIECIGLSNITQLTKYVPGKVWSYAIQMHLLAKHDVSKTRVLSTNILMLLSLMASAAVIGCGYLMFAGAVLPTVLARVLFVCVAATYLCLVFGGTRTINALISLANRALRRNIGRIEIPFRVVLHIHATNFVANVAYGLAGYLIALGVGAPLQAALAGPVVSATLLSDLAGFLAVVAPGGVGVREGVMYAMLTPFLDIQTCLALLVTFRLVTMACDLLLGGSAMYLLYHFNRKRRHPTTRHGNQNA